jgi:hypothetical protein
MNKKFILMPKDNTSCIIYTVNFQFLCPDAFSVYY